MNHRTTNWFVVAAAALLLTACGGGSGQVDVPPPLVVVSFPSTVALTGASQITVIGRSPDPELVVDVVANGVSATSADDFANWAVVVPLQSGDNTIRIDVEDDQGEVHTDVATLDVHNVGVATAGMRAVTRDPGSGDIFALDDLLNGLYQVDSEAGRTIAVSDDTRGTGDPIEDPQSVSVDTVFDRFLVVLGKDGAGLGVHAIDPVTGNRTVLSDAETGTGTEFEDPRGSDFDPLAIFLLVADSGPSTLALIGVSAFNGNRTILSDASTGEGTEFMSLEDVAVDPDTETAFVTDSAMRAVFRIDLVTGDRTILSDDATGLGPVFASPTGIELDAANDRLFVADKDLGAVLSVDLENGNRFVLSGPGTGEGPSLDEPCDLQLSGDSLLVADGQESLLAVDTSNGDRSILAPRRVGSGPGISDGPFDVGQTATVDAAFLAARADGESAVYRVSLGSSRRTLLWQASGAAVGLDLRQIAVQSSGQTFYMLDAGTGGIYQVNVGLLSASVVSNNFTGTGPQFSAPTDLALEENSGQLFYVDPGLAQVVAVSLPAGNRTILSDADNGSGPDFDAPNAIALHLAGGRILVHDAGLEALLAVNLITGNRTILSDAGTGAGPEFGDGGVALALDAANDRAFILDRSGRRVFAVDLQTGDREILQDLVDRNGPPLDAPASIWFEPRRQGLLVADPRHRDEDLGPGLVSFLEAGPEAVPETERVTLSR